MSTLNKRLQRLEASHPPIEEVVVDREGFLRSKAMQQLSEEQLLGLRDFLEAKKEGRPLTSRAEAGRDAYSAALEKECQKIGHRSIVAF